MTSDFQFGTGPSKPESSSNANLVGLSAKEKSVTTPFVLKEPEDKKTEAPVAGGFTFGKLDQKESSSSFVFGKNEEKTESTPAATSFGSKSDGEQSKTFLFGKPEAGKADTSTLSSFAFGAPNPMEKKEADQPAKPAFTFGPSATGRRSFLVVLFTWVLSIDADSISILLLLFFFIVRHIPPQG